MKTKQLNDLQKQLEKVNEEMCDINDDITSINAALNSNDISKAFNVASIIKKYKIASSGNHIQAFPTFTPKPIPEEFSQLFGALSSSLSIKSEEHCIKTTEESPEAVPSPVAKRLLDEPQTVTTICTDHAYLYSIAFLSDTEIWTCGNGNTMKLYSISQGPSLKSFTTRSGYWLEDITVTKRGHLAYTDYKDRSVNIAKNGEIQTIIKLQNWKPRGICRTSSGDLLVIMDGEEDQPSKVVRYSGSTEKQTIQFYQGQPLYSSGSSYRYITENRNLDICVADSGAKAAVVVNMTGKLKFRYTGHTPSKNY
jgi:hypothetical protein